jgi:signal transduction histidine kinase
VSTSSRPSASDLPLDSPTQDTQFLPTLAAESRAEPGSMGTLTPLLLAATTRQAIIVGLAGILGAVFILFWVHRYLSVQTALRQAEGSVLATTQAIAEPALELLTPIGADAVADGARHSAALTQLQSMVSSAIVKRIQLYDAGGRVIVSIGADATASGAAPSPLPAQPVTLSHLQDRFGSMGDAAIAANQALAQMPMHLPGETTTGGLLEVTTDISPLLPSLSRAHFLVSGGVGVILLAVYGAFLVGMRQIGAQVRRQNEELQRSAELLPALFRRSMHAEEVTRQRIVAELEHKVAQTLDSVKTGLEDAAAAVRRGDAGASAKLDAAVPPLQQMIAGVRDVAAALHRPGDVQVGLREAVEAMLGEMRSRRPDIDVSLRVELTGSNVSDALQPVIRRAIESALAGAIANGFLTRLRILVGIEGGDLIFRLRDDATSDKLDAPDNPYARLHEHVLLSGGRIGFRANSWGGIVIRAAWRHA